jgi:inner membrane protein
MLIKTHFAITIFGILLLITAVEHKIVFVIMALIATFIPDIDSRFSVMGRKKLNRILQFFTKHRGFFHSFTFLVLITLIFLSVFPVAALGFFVGYGLHLIADSFTSYGITPFAPFSKKKSSGFMVSGKKFENFVFISFILFDILLLWIRLSDIYLLVK